MTTNIWLFSFSFGHPDRLNQPKEFVLWLKYEVA